MPPPRSANWSCLDCKCSRRDCIPLPFSPSFSSLRPHDVNNAVILHSVAKHPCLKKPHVDRHAGRSFAELPEVGGQKVVGTAANALGQR